MVVDLYSRLIVSGVASVASVTIGFGGGVPAPASVWAIAILIKQKRALTVMSVVHLSGSAESW
jgi:hypothetical protein